MSVRRVTTLSQRLGHWGLEPALMSVSQATWWATVLRPNGCGSASGSTESHEVAPGKPGGGCPPPLVLGLNRLTGKALPISDQE